MRSFFPNPAVPLALLLVLTGCSDDDGSPAGGNGDNPPVNGNVTIVPCRANTEPKQLTGSGAVTAHALIRSGDGLAVLRSNSSGSPFIQVVEQTIDSEGNLGGFSPVSQFFSQIVKVDSAELADGTRLVGYAAKNSDAAPSVFWQHTSLDGTWSVPAPAMPETLGTENIALSVLGDDRWFAAWTTYDAGARKLFYAVLDRAGTQVISPTEIGTSDLLALTVAKNNTQGVIVYTTQVDGMLGTSSLWLRRYDADSDQFSNPVQLVTQARRILGQPTALKTQKGVIVAWAESVEGSHARIRLVLVQNDDSLLSERQFSDPDISSLPVLANYFGFGAMSYLAKNQSTTDLKVEIRLPDGGPFGEAEGSANPITSVAADTSRLFAQTAPGGLLGLLYSSTSGVYFASAFCVD